MFHRQPQIIASGGAGFSADPQDALLMEYLLKQTGASRPKVCFVPTATGDSEEYTARFYDGYKRYDCIPSDLMFFRRTPDVRDTLLKQDLIYVGGGNTKSMLAVWREWGVVEILREAWEAGIVLSGVSAGAICWFEQGLTDSFANKLQVIDCLGFLKGSLSPHYDGEPERRPSYHDFISNGRIRQGIALDDNVAAHFIGTELKACISTRPAAGAYVLQADDQIAVETPIEVIHLA